MTNSFGPKGLLSGRLKQLNVAAVLAIGLTIFAALSLLGCSVFASRGEVDVMEAIMQSPERLELVVASCNENPEVSLLRETEDDVQVRVIADYDFFAQSGDDCQDIVEVQLQDPLGDRVVIDEHTGRLVSVTPVATATPRTSRQEQAESPPTEAVPPEIRDAVSDAELQDLQAVAEQYGMTLQEAFDRYAWNDDFSRAVSRVRESTPETFAGAEIVDATNAWIAFTGTPPKAALDIIDTFTSSYSSVSVEVRTNQSITEAELVEAISAVHNAVYKAPEVLDASTVFDSKKAQIESLVVLESTAPDSVVDDLRAIAEKRLVEVTREDILDSISISVTRSKIPVIFIKE